jgi:hypothetical protein
MLKTKNFLTHLSGYVQSFNESKWRKNMDPDNVFTATQKLELTKRLTLSWSVYLSHIEFRVFSWIFGNTIVRGSHWGYYSITQMVRGVPKYDSEGSYWCAGTGLSRSSVIRALASLQQKGALLAQTGDNASFYSNYYAINLDWSPWRGG